MPFLSMVRSACAETRSLTQRFSLATQKRRSCRFGWKRRRVLLLACETLLPVCTFLPETWQTRDIAHLGNVGCIFLGQEDGGPGGCPPHVTGVRGTLQGGRTTCFRPPARDSGHSEPRIMRDARGDGKLSTDPGPGRPDAIAG